MNISTCEQCGNEVRRRGQKVGRFCSMKCKAEWQRTQKPVDEAWLRQKYLVEQLGTYDIAKLVDRNAKQVYWWLVGYQIPIRQRGWETESTGKPYQDKEWLEGEYVAKQRAAIDIANEFGITEANVYHYLRKFDIPRRDMAVIRKSKHWGLTGEANPMFGKRGPEVPNYIDGSTPERQAMYSSIPWKKSVASVYRRDKHTCVKCGARYSGPRSLCAHHLKPWAGNPDLRLDIDNMVILCRTCHLWVHSKKNVNREYIK